MMIGQSETVTNLLIGLLADGHVLLEGAPGLAKTRIARLLSQSMEGVFNRIQFTPDLLPSDLTGSAIYDSKEQRFDFQEGPIFGNFILADEINRAPAKVQSALLEAMEERQVTSGKTSFRLDEPFFVMATQNPIEHEGTWDLPQAQLDRFLMHIRVDYPDLAAERDIFDLVLKEAVEAGAPGELPVPITKAALSEARRSVLDVHLSDPIRDYIVRLIAGTRADPKSLVGVDEHLSHPVSPRGSVSLGRTSQARAWLMERDHVLPEDVAALAPNVLRHRMGLSYRAEADGVTPDEIIQNLLEQVDVV
jgi:MoxR-like ATPase